MLNFTGRMFVNGGFTANSETSGEDQHGSFTCLYGTPESACYDLATDSWTKKASSIEVLCRRTFHASTMIAPGELFVFGGMGSSDNVCLNDGAIYSLDTDEWEKVAEYDGPGFIGQSVVLIDPDHVLVYGGFRGDKFNSKGNLYNLKTKVWAQTSDSLTGDVLGRAHHSACVIAPGLMFVSGGRIHGYYHAEDCGIYDYANNSWASVISAYNPSLSSPAGQNSVCISLGKVLMYGCFGKGLDKEMRGSIYDVAQNTWQPIASSDPFVTPRTGFSLVAIAKNKALVYGGSMRKYCSDGAIYDMESNTWKKITSSEPVFGARSNHTASRI